MLPLSIKNLPAYTTIQLGAGTLFQQASQHYSKQEYDQAFALFNQAAEKGWPSAILLLAHCHNNGQGTPLDQGMATHYYKIAAKYQQPEAMFRLYKAYKNGYGVEIDHEVAEHWLEKALQLGHRMARNLRFWQDLFVNPDHVQTHQNISHNKPLG